MAVVSVRMRPRLALRDMALIAVIGWIFFGQRLDAPAILGMGMIIGGVVVLNVFSSSVAH